MTDAVMFFDIGFLVAALLGLLIVLHVHNRSARLGSVGHFHAEVGQLEEQLAVALGERANSMRDRCDETRAELTWATERVESALFRERINDVAYEIVRITQALESSGSIVHRTNVCLCRPSDRTANASTTDQWCERPGHRAHDACGRARGPHSCFADDSFARGGELKALFQI